VGRRLGQHFLSRKSILDRIAHAACGATRCPLVIEIGPGKGALTGPLLELASHVVAIEVDPYLIHYLRQKFAAAVEAERLTLIEGDVLKTDFAALVGERGGHSAITGNLPYYITSPILERVFAVDGLWDRAVFLVQAEVAARLAAVPGSRIYGYLSVLTQVHAHPDILFEVPRTSFHPAPKVDSAVVQLEPRAATSGSNVSDKQEFLRFAAACFRHKRKTLRNNLNSRYGQDCVDALPEGRLRAEQLSVEQLVGLYRKLESVCPRV
jgi:16S rRNA (adenine1518-N6/adenine1519-N6)-dimethyltransferase